MTEADKLLGKLTVGLDFGTSNTIVASSNRGWAEILRNDRRETQTPSVVAFHEERILVGDETSASTIRPENIIYAIKRFLGITCTELMQKRYRDERFQPQKDQSTTEISIENTRYTVEQIVGILLSKVKIAIEKEYGVLGGAVLTVPSSFEPPQRRSLLYAAAIAEIPVLQLIEETTAAAIAFACRKPEEESRNILIFQLGGGFFDVAIFRIAGHSIELLSSVASCDIGGEDFTQEIMNLVRDKRSIQETKQHGIKKSKIARTESPTILMQLRTSSEKAKKDLSKGKETKIKFQDDRHTLSREIFDDRNKIFLAGIRFAINCVLCKANLKKENIDNYLMIGRFTVMPNINHILDHFFEDSRRKDIVKVGEAAVSSTTDTRRKDILKVGEAAVSGAAILAEFLTGQSELDLQLQVNVNRERVLCCNGKECEKPKKSDEKIIKFVVRTSVGSGIKKETLNKMTDEVKTRSTADEKWMATDEANIKFCEGIHKAQDKIEDLLKQTDNREEKEKLYRLQQDCEELVNWICEVETITKEDYDKRHAILDSIGDELKKITDGRKQKMEEDKIELDRRIRALLDRIQDFNKKNSTESLQTRDIGQLNMLHKTVEDLSDWICNVDNISQSTLQINMREIKTAEEKLEELITGMECYKKENGSTFNSPRHRSHHNESSVVFYSSYPKYGECAAQFEFAKTIPEHATKNKVNNSQQTTRKVYDIPHQVVPTLSSSSNKHRANDGHPGNHPGALPVIHRHYASPGQVHSQQSQVKIQQTLGKKQPSYVSSHHCTVNISQAPVRHPRDISRAVGSVQSTSHAKQTPGNSGNQETSGVKQFFSKILPRWKY